MFNIIILGITSLLTDISSEMVYPILPLYLTTVLGVGPQVIGLIEGIAESIASLLKVFSGGLSDKLKKRKGLTLFGYASSGVGKLFLALSSMWSHVLIGRIIDRFGKGIRVAPRDALIADSIDEKRRGMAFGFHRMLDTLGAALGVLFAYFFLLNLTKGAAPTGGAGAGQSAFRSIFLLSLIPAFLGVVVLAFVKEKKDPFGGPPAAKFSFVSGWKSLDKRLRAFLIVSFIFTLGNSSNQFLLLRSNNLGQTAATVVLMYFIYNVSYALLSYPAGFVSDKIGRKKVLVCGYILYGAVYLGFALTKSPNYIWLLFVVYGFYAALTEGVEKAFLVDVAPNGLRSTTIGLHATLVGIGLFPASFLAGFMWHFLGASAPFYFGGAMGLIAATALYFLL